jgi:hypothetical protein
VTHSARIFILGGGYLGDGGALGPGGEFFGPSGPTTYNLLLRGPNDQGVAAGYVSDPPGAHIDTGRVDAGNGTGWIDGVAVDAAPLVSASFSAVGIRYLGGGRQASLGEIAEIFAYSTAIPDCDLPQRLGRHLGRRVRTRVAETWGRLRLADEATMKRFPFDTIALMSGALLFVFVQLYGAAASFVLLLLLELFEAAPRVAMFGILLVAIGPIAVIASLHHGADRTMAKGKELGLLPSAEAWWAGALGWLVIVGATMLTTLVLLVVNPPERDGSVASLLGHLALLATQAPGKQVLHGVVWIASASLFYGLERASRVERDA